VILDILRAAQTEVCRPWPRYSVSAGQWTSVAGACVAGTRVLLAHWADTAQVHALLLDPAALSVVVVSTAVADGHYPALSAWLPGAAWYERMVHDLWGHVADGGLDARPWLDHGAWPQTPPMAVRPPPSRGPMAQPALDSLDAMVLPLGPIWGQLEEAAHLRLTLQGSAIRRAEARLGFTHKGVLTLMRGKSPRAAARFAARLSGDATVAHSLAYAQAAEAAMDVAAPLRAGALRIVMLEVERIAGHLLNLGEVGRLADAPAIWSRCGGLRETLARASEAAFGHRLMMDCVVPGGVATDIAPNSAAVLRRAMGDIARGLEAIRRLHDRPGVAARLAGLGWAGSGVEVGGVVGRASGRRFDARWMGSGRSESAAGGITAGDAAARQSLRMIEIEDSLRLVSAALGALPEGAVTVALPAVSGEGIGCAESVRGDVWHWLRLDRGQIAAVFPRDPGWVLWPLAERVLETAAADDVALLRASFGLPASGMDL
jgi:Ni,Fe-hydrogenase III large subunit